MGSSLLRIGKNHPWAVALILTALVAGVSRCVSDAYSASVVGLVFLGATYLLAIAGASDADVRAAGLSLGGLFEARPLDLARMVREFLRAFLVALLAAIVIFPPFLVGFVFWWQPAHAFHFRPPTSWNDELFGQALVIALPEEAFYRGFLLKSFDDTSKRRWRVLGTEVGMSVVWTSALFALGHLATEPNPARLAVFFPALVFAWLRLKTGGIGAGVLFHVLCNVFASELGRGYGLWH